MLQKQLAAEVNVPYTSYNKVENNTRDMAIDELERFAGYFGMTIDQMVHFDNQLVEITIQDKPNFEQVNLITNWTRKTVPWFLRSLTPYSPKKSSRTSFKRMLLRCK